MNPSLSIVRMNYLRSTYGVSYGVSCAPQRVWASVLLLLSLAVSSIAALPPTASPDEVNQELIEASESGDDGQCLLQTHTELKLKSNRLSFSSTKASEGQSEDESDDVHESEAPVMAEQKPADVQESEAKLEQKGLSLLGIVTQAKKSHVLGGLISLAATESGADSSNQAWFTVVIIVAVLFIAGTLAICLSMEPWEPHKDPYAEPLTRAPRGSHRGSHRPPPPPPPPHRLSTTPEDRISHVGMAPGPRDMLQRELRGAISRASPSPSVTGTPPAFMTGTPPMPRPSISHEPLCPSLVLSHGEAAYLLPDLGHMAQTVEAYDILNQAGSCVLGCVVNDGSDDPGIVLHYPRTDDGAGLPLAFVGTSMALYQAGSLPIARTGGDKHGEFFANLNRDLQGGSYSIRKDGLSFMRFEGDFVGRSIFLYDKGSSQPIGSTRPLGEVYGRMCFEFRLSAGKDAALAFLGLLAITRLENDRPTWSSSEASRQSVQADPGAVAGNQGPLFSLGGLHSIRR